MTACALDISIKYCGQYSCGIGGYRWRISDNSKKCSSDSFISTANLTMEVVPSFVEEEDDKVALLHPTIDSANWKRSCKGLAEARAVNDRNEFRKRSQHSWNRK